ncbi:ABC transporter [Dermabacter sp. HMSC06F07]|uniref:ABC transporter ATP-binding protein n=1 Tax=Dermabacter sp. HMSC06F07 TaxID=1581125 RepID=UPI0008A23096|nr:ABC transporter ATP-binding protein [Dermabacter sp. HMSC06F07]OFT45800.1 ABC transporter [Dermabacter sp. HMSC06F07]
MTTPHNIQPSSTVQPAVGTVPGARPIVLSARNLALAYDAHTHALRGVDLDIYSGQSLAIMGPSGCGKSTLLHCLAGILAPTGGRVLYGERDLRDMRDAARTKLRRTDFGFVFQDGQLLPELSALENVMLPRMLAGVSRRKAKGMAKHWLAALGLSGLEERRPGQLSGGQAQRVAIARALAGEPSVVYADEPTGALDQKTGQEVLHLLLQATADAGSALVMVTHDEGVAAACARTIVMRDGQIEREVAR